MYSFVVTLQRLDEIVLIYYVLQAMLVPAQQYTRVTQPVHDKDCEERREAEAAAAAAVAAGAAPPLKMPPRGKTSTVTSPVLFLGHICGSILSMEDPRKTITTCSPLISCFVYLLCVQYLRCSKSP